MATIRRTIEVPRPLTQVFDYLSDFTTTNEWDPGTVETVRVKGQGGVGTEYLNRSRFGGRETELTYVVEDLVRNQVFALRGENKSVCAHDTMTFRETPAGTSVTYVAEFTFKGAAKVAAPFLGRAFTKLGDEAEEGMRQALLRL